MFFLSRAKIFVCAKSLKLLYYSLFHSNLLCYIGTLSAMSKSNVKKILTVQKKAIRTISNAKYNDHNGPLFFKHQMLPNFILLFYRGCSEVKTIGSIPCSSIFFSRPLLSLFDPFAAPSRPLTALKFPRPLEIFYGHF
jgi:hypothetical protein